jgi:excisionase family DNA binding protein
MTGSPPRPPEAEPWVSMEVVAAHLGVVKDTVYRWIEGRHLPAHRIGRLWKCKLSEVDAWVRSGGAADESNETDTQPGAPRGGKAS